MKKKSKTSSQRTTKKTGAKASSASPKTSKKKISKGRKAAQKVKSAAAHIRKTTKKMVDDVFLKIVGMKVLERAKVMAKDIKKEKRSDQGRK